MQTFLCNFYAKFYTASETDSDYTLSRQQRQQRHILGEHISLKYKYFINTILTTYYLADSDIVPSRNQMQTTNAVGKCLFVSKSLLSQTNLFYSQILLQILSLLLQIFKTNR